MRRLLVIPGLLFGLLFAGGGFFLLAETAVPMWQDWRRMQDWRPVPGRLLSVTAADNETRVSYRYEFDGSEYVGHRAGVAAFKDNIGPYQRDLQRRLAGLQGSGETLTLWVNPANPAESVIDRDQRWGLFALVSGFCSVFILLGLGVMVASLRSSGRTAQRPRLSYWELRQRWQRARVAGETDLEFEAFCEQRFGGPERPREATLDWQGRRGWEDARIASDARRGAWIFWGFALLWNAVSTPLLFILPGELAKGNSAALLVLLFPAVGLFLVYQALRRTLEYRRYGKILFHMDPYPGAIGGHVGGYLQVRNLDYRAAAETEDLAVTLECVYSYVSGSGENRSRREKIRWAERGRPKVDRASEGVNLVFRFAVPDDLPPADVERDEAYHCWRLGVSADLPGVDLNRSYDIPVFATGERSRGVGHDISAQVAAERKRDADAAGLAIASGRFDIEGLSRSLRLTREGDLIRLRFPMFRNRMLTLFAALFAGGFGLAAYGMFDWIGDGGVFGLLMGIFAIPFVLVAVLAGLATVYLLLNNLNVSIRPGEVSVSRRLFWLPLLRRRLSRGEIAHLGIRRSGSTGQGVHRIEHFKIQAEDRRGRKLTLAEDIDGEDVARHFRDYLAQRIGVGTR